MANELTQQQLLEQVYELAGADNRDRLGKLFDIRF